MLIDRGDKCRCLKISNQKIEDVVLGAVRAADHRIVLLAAGNFVCLAIQ